MKKEDAPEPVESSEEGCLWCDQHSHEDPDDFVLVEAFRSGAARGWHAHFKSA